MFDESKVNEIVNIATSKVDAKFEETMIKEIDNLFDDQEYFRMQCDQKDGLVYSVDVRLYFVRQVNNNMNGLNNVNLQIYFPNRKGNSFITVDVSEYFSSINFSELPDDKTVGLLRSDSTQSTNHYWYINGGAFISDDSLKNIYKNIVNHAKHDKYPKRFETSSYKFIDAITATWEFRF